jgi:hypothetical protein
MEHAVILHIALSDDCFGSSSDREAITSLEDSIMAVFQEKHFGELDGDEFGEGECIIYTYGPDADILYSLIEPFLAANSGILKGYAIKRYGEPNDPNAREVQIMW